MPKRYIVALAIFAIILLGGIFLAIRALTNNDKPKEQKQTQQQQTPAKSLSKDARSVLLVEQGEVVGEEQRRSIRIVVTRTERTVEVLQGYDETVVKSQTFPNTASAYEEFLHAIEAAGYTSYDPKITQDFRGACPTGKRYILKAEFTDNSNHESWDSSCSRQGNSLGNSSLIRSLFHAQVPEYSKFVADVKLN